MEKCQTDDYAMPQETVKEDMNWPPAKHRCVVLRHSGQCNGTLADFEPCDKDVFSHCQKCPHCRIRILNSIFETHLEQCKERSVLEGL